MPDCSRRVIGVDEQRNPHARLNLDGVRYFMSLDPNQEANETVTIYTVGHSNHSIADFLSLLKRHSIASLVDVRSAPYSRYAPQFNRSDLEYSVEAQNIRYTFMGDELGGRPPGDDFYDQNDHVLYYLVAKAPFFRRGLDRLVEEGSLYRTAIMCSEEDPADCHRRLLIARVLLEEGVSVVHIRADDTEHIEREMTLRKPTLWGAIDSNEQEETEWKSIRPVSRKRPQNNSSNQFDLWGSDDF